MIYDVENKETQLNIWGEILSLPLINSCFLSDDQATF